jgi:hypothetical protein
VQIEGSRNQKNNEENMKEIEEVTHAQRLF